MHSSRRPTHGRKKLKQQGSAFVLCSDNNPTEAVLGYRFCLEAFKNNNSAARFFSLVKTLGQKRHLDRSGKNLISFPGTKKKRNTIAESASASSSKPRVIYPVFMAYRRRSSPGPREFGTMTLTAALPLRQEIFCTTCECPCAEKPSPPRNEDNQ